VADQAQVAGGRYRAADMRRQCATPCGRGDGPAPEAVPAARDKGLADDLKADGTGMAASDCPPRETHPPKGTHTHHWQSLSSARVPSACVSAAAAAAGSRSAGALVSVLSAAAALSIVPGCTSGSSPNRRPHSAHARVSRRCRHRQVYPHGPYTQRRHWRPPPGHPACAVVRRLPPAWVWWAAWVVRAAACCGAST
jgi:hypothetical protein